MGEVSGINEIRDRDAKLTFIFGVVLIAMPFFMREEAGEMDRIFL